jgi:hypothetical protein
MISLRSRVTNQFRRTLATETLSTVGESGLAGVWFDVRFLHAEIAEKN